MSKVRPITVRDIVLFVDDSIIAINKPANLATIREGWNAPAPHLRGLLEAEFGRVWIVHRLDKTTTGVVLFARSAGAHRHLSLQFERREAHKTYHAIIIGTPDWDERVASQPLRVNVGRNHRTVVDWKKGKEAVTYFRIKDRYALYSLLEAKPLTGRTHQIRAQVADLGFPILGDTLYGSEPTDMISRPALHAYSLNVMHPVTSKPQTFFAAYTDDFLALLKCLSV